MFALATLEALRASAHDLVLVVTQPDRPRNRGQRVTASPVKEFALQHGLPVLQPQQLKAEDFLSAIQRSDLDVAVVAAYGRILPAVLLTVPRLGFINVHGSLLPRWRGAAPVHRAILAGDVETGVTIMRVVPALDAGPMLAKRAVPIPPDETSEMLERRLAGLGAELLVQILNEMSAGPVPEEPQQESAVTYAPRLERSEGRVDWAKPAAVIHNQIRGLQPWPGATVLFGDKRLLLLQSTVEDRAHATAPGTVLDTDRLSFSVACGAGAVRIHRVQLEGRAAVAVREFLNGHRFQPGDVLRSLAANL